MLSKKISEIVFPIYKLPKHRRIYTNSLGIIYMETEKNVWVLDDTNLTTPFFVRRTYILASGRKLYPLKKAIALPMNLIQEPGNTCYMDSSGSIFKYKKGGKYWKLKYYEIDNMELVMEGTRISCAGMSFFFGTNLSTTSKYLGLLEKAGMYIPYDLSVDKKKTTRRMI